MIHTAGGRFRPDEEPIYFIASGPKTSEETLGLSPYILIAVNELHSRKNRNILSALLDAGVCIMLDSGVFNLAASHARANRIPIQEAITYPPEQVDGFDELLKDYLEITEEFGDRLWGYVEIDQGPRDQKRITRRKLEALGRKPIPVYHPWSDGWDYFDELCEGYDRICFSNLVTAPPADRIRLLATAWERRRAKYPNLWIHALGVTPSTALLAFPTQSCDSSTWSGHTRWGRFTDSAMCRTVGDLDNGLRAGRRSTHGDDGPADRIAAMQVAATGATILGYNLRGGLDANQGHAPLLDYPPLSRPT
jgi:hypothetical protein